MEESRLSHSVNDIQLDPLSVDIVIVNTRGTNNPWFVACRQSCAQQTYHDVGVMVVDNNDRALAIGEAYNLGAFNSNADLVLYVGDDDVISIDTVAHLVGTMQMVRKAGHPNLKMVTSYCTLIDGAGKVLDTPTRRRDGTTEQLRPALLHQGLYDRAWLLENPFSITHRCHVGREMHHRLRMLQEAAKHRMYWATAYHYGYHYRQHVGMVSGENHALKIAR